MTSSEIDSEKQIAALAHQRSDENLSANFRAAIDFGLEAIRTATIINGGSVLACFAFLGIVVQTGHENSEIVFISAVWFAIGTIASGLASGAAYFSQIMFAESSASIKIWDRPFVIQTEDDLRAQSWGEFWRVIAVSLVLGSYTCVIVGTYRVFVGFTFGN